MTDRAKAIEATTWRARRAEGAMVTAMEALERARIACNSAGLKCDGDISAVQARLEEIREYVAFKAAERAAQAQGVL